MFKDKKVTLVIETLNRHIDRLERTIDRLMEERLFYLKDKEPVALGGTEPEQKPVGPAAYEPEVGTIFNGERLG